MKFRDKNKKEEKDEKKEGNNGFEIVMGDESVLEISDVGDHMNDLRPKGKPNQKKNIVIPHTKKKYK